MKEGEIGRRPFFNWISFLITLIGKKGEFDVKKIAALMFIAVAVAFSFLSCSQDETEEIPVGVIISLTGSLANFDLENALDLALEEVNASLLPDGRKIRFIFEDSESTPDGAERAYRKLIEREEVVAILGPHTSDAVKEIIPALNENGVLVLSPTSAASGLSAQSDFLFRCSLTVEHLVPKGVRVIREELGYRKVAAIANRTDTFSQSNLELLKREFDKYEDVSIVSEQVFDLSADGQLPDLTDQLTRIKDADPDAIFVSALPPAQVGVMVQARQLGIADIPFVVTHLAINVVRLANTTEPGSAEGSITSTSWVAATDTPENRKFLRNYREKYGSEPGSFAALSYVSVYILAEAISNAPSTDPRAIRDAIADIRLNTPLGEFYFDRNGDAVYEAIVARVKDGKFEVIGR